MKFGLSFLPINAVDLSPTAYFKTALKLAQIADAAGMSTIKIDEYDSYPYREFYTDSLTFLAAMAAVTKNIRLMANCGLPFHHPIKIVAQTAMIDAISNGRLDVGFTRAYFPHVFDVLQIAKDNTNQIYEETIESVIQLWKEEQVTLVSEYFYAENKTSLPKTIQQPHPPVWGTAAISRRSFAWLGEKGFNLLVTPLFDGLSQLQNKIDIYIEALKENHPYKNPAVTLSLPLLIDENSFQAKKLGDYYLQHYLQLRKNTTDSWPVFVSSNDSSVSALLRDHTPEKMRRNLQAVIGSPAEIIDAIGAIAELVNVQQIIWQIDFGAQPESIAQHTLALFIDRVYPHLPMNLRK